MSRREVMFWTVELLLTECSPRWNTHPLCVGVVGVVSVGGGGGDMWHASPKCWITLTPPHLGQPDVSRLVPVQKNPPKHHSGLGLVIFFRRRCLFNLALIFNGGSQRGWNWENDQMAWGWHIIIQKYKVYQSERKGENKLPCSRTTI